MRAPAPVPDPVAAAVTDALDELVAGVRVSVVDHEADRPPPPGRVGAVSAPGPDGRCTAVTVEVTPRVGRLLDSDAGPLTELVSVLPRAALATIDRFLAVAGGELGATLRRAIRDDLAAEILGAHLQSRVGSTAGAPLVAEVVGYLLELSATRVEAHPLTHGVVVAEVWGDTPRLSFPYPAALRPAKRAPLLFDGRRSVLVVDGSGRARSEIHPGRLRALTGGRLPVRAGGPADRGSLVGAVTGALGGVGFYLDTDRTVWTFADGQPLLVRRGEHWTAFPVRLAASLTRIVGDPGTARLVAETALLVSAEPHGAILAVVDDPARLSGVVQDKDRYDLRDAIDPSAMRPETRLHHLIDAEPLTPHTLARLATLDGATALDRSGRLVAYGAIVSSSDSQHEGARTAAARTLSRTAVLVLKVSVDGDITIFEDGEMVTTLLAPPDRRGR